MCELVFFSVSLNPTTQSLIASSLYIEYMAASVSFAAPVEFIRNVVLSGGIEFRNAIRLLALLSKSDVGMYLDLLFSFYSPVA